MSQCEDKEEEQVELLQLDRSGIRVAAYLSEMPPREVLRKTLKAVADAGAAWGGGGLMGD